MPAKKDPVLPNRAAVVATLAELGVDAKVNARGQLCLTLADQLDAGAGMATAAVSRELRETLKDLEAGGGGDDELAALLAGLSTPVVDAKN